MVNNCRGNKREYRDNKKDKLKIYYEHSNLEILEKSNASKEAKNPWVTCSRCQKEVRSISFEKHQNDYVCQVYPMNPKPDYHEWLYSNPDFFPSVVETREKEDLNIVSWTFKSHGTSSAVSDDKLKEYEDKELNIDYIWKWRDGPHNKIQI